MKEMIKKALPTDLWPSIRKRMIIFKHARVGRICRTMIDNYYDDKMVKYQLVAKQQDLNSDVIWQYWGQGFHTENLPEIVRLCMDSVEKYKGKHKIIRISDDNISDYIDLPDFVIRKKNDFPRAIFSDLLRVSLLKAYGGVWLDATILLTGQLPERYFKSDFFMFQRDDKEVNKDYWEKSYAYYWGWYPGFKVRVLNSVIFAKKGSEVMSFLSNVLLHLWEKKTKVPDYFFFQILFHELINKYPDLNCPIESDCPPHYIQQMLSEESPLDSFKEVSTKYGIHKLTYKDNGKEFASKLRKMQELQD
jgi:hypothetical protein